jgi:hypothetical protein
LDSPHITHIPEHLLSAPYHILIQVKVLKVSLLSREWANRQNNLENEIKFMAVCLRDWLVFHAFFNPATFGQSLRKQDCLLARNMHPLLQPHKYDRDAPIQTLLLDTIPSLC